MLFFNTYVVYESNTNFFGWWNIRTGTTFVSWSINPQAHSSRPSADTISHASHPPSPSSISLAPGLGDASHPRFERTIKEPELSGLKNRPTV